MRNGKFQMYDDDIQRVMLVRGAPKPSGVTSYAPARFPTKNIVTPIVLLYGDHDSLVDIVQMMRELPSHTVAMRLHGYEHLDVLWGCNVDIDVLPHVIEMLRQHCVDPHRVAEQIDMPQVQVNGLTVNLHSGYITPTDIDTLSVDNDSDNKT